MGSFGGERIGRGAILRGEACHPGETIEERTEEPDGASKKF